MTLGVLMQIFSGSLRNAEIAQDQAQAVALAQSVLAVAGIETPLVAGEISGQAGNKFRWTLQVQPYQEELQSSSVLPAGNPMIELWEVKVEVRWGGNSDANGRSFSLSSLRLKTSPPS